MQLIGDVIIIAGVFLVMLALLALLGSWGVGKIEPRTLIVGLSMVALGFMIIGFGMQFKAG